MAEELSKPTSTTIRREAARSSKRKLAGNLSRQLRKRIMAAPLGKKISREQYLSKMLIDLATNWEAQTLDGKVITITDIKEWSEIVKFIHAHIDGPVGQEGQFNGINVFKVYAGIDVDKV